MVQQRKWSMQRMGRMAAGLLLVPWTGITATLFLCTGQPLPRSFQSWESIGCVPLWLQDFSQLKDTTPRFYLLSECGNYYATTLRSREDLVGQHFDVSIHEISSNHVVCRLKQVKGLPQVMQINSDSGNLLLVAESTDLYEWPSGQWIQNILPTESNPLTIVLDSGKRRYALADRCGVAVLDLQNQQLNSELRFRRRLGAGEILDVYFDKGDSLKALVLKLGRVSHWHIMSKNPDWESPQTNGDLSISAQAASVPDDNQTVTALPNQNIFVAYHHKFGICVRSLEDGSVLSIHKLADDARPIRFSDDGRYAICLSRVERGWIKAVRHLPPRFQKWLQELDFSNSQYAIESRASLLDLQSGKIYPGINVSNRAEVAGFQRNSQALLTAADEGLYTWDLPPRWRWFTPWAWSALAGWVALAGAWWRLGRRQKVESASQIPAVTV